MADYRQRPSFARSNTDGVPLATLDKDTGKSVLPPEKYTETKDGGVVDIKGDDLTPDEPIDEDGFHVLTAPVETAKDLITQVLHVEDDPSLNPFTFRLFFLGMSGMLSMALYTDLVDRLWTIALRLRPSGDLLLQTPNNLRVGGLLVCYCLRAW